MLEARHSEELSTMLPSSEKPAGTIENDVLIGHNGYLFLAGGAHQVADIATGKIVIDAASYTVFRENLEARIAWSNTNSCRFVHVIMPDKQSIIPGEWPLSPPLKLGQTYLDQNKDLAEYLIYPIKQLTAEWQRTVLRIDTHLSAYGSFLVASMLVDKLTPGLHLNVDIASTMNQEQLIYGDLGSKLNPPVCETEQILEHFPPGHVFQNDIEGGSNGGVDLRFNPEAPCAKRVVLFGDSFGRNLAQFLQFFYSEVFFFRTGFFHEEIASLCKPDILITESIERYIDHCQPDSHRPHFLLYPHFAKAPYVPPLSFTEALSAVLGVSRHPYVSFLAKLRPPPAPRPLKPVIADAQAAATRGDWNGALELWREVAARFPDNVLGWIGSAAALRELDRLDEAKIIVDVNLAQFPNDLGAAVETAALLQRQTDWAAAVDQWARIRALFPDHPIGTLGAVWPLRVLGRFEDAEALLADAVGCFPKNAQIAVQYAASASDANRWPEALERWEIVRRAFPGEPRGHTGASFVLRETQRFDEAEQLLTEAERFFPGNIDVAKELAGLAIQLQHWPVAAARWEAIHANFPDRLDGYVGLASMFMSRSLPHEAEGLLLEAIPRFPASFELRMFHARAAMQGGRVPEAVARWRIALQLAPSNIHAVIGLAECLIELGDFDAADEQLKAYQAQRLRVPKLAITCCTLLERRGDLIAARKHWREVRDAFPHNSEVAYHFNAAKIRLLDDQEVPSPSGGTNLGEPEETKLPSKYVSHVLADFEALGENCEFGLVQRAFGLEPLGLLRWSATPIEQLIDALNRKFDGVGELAQTEIKNEEGEYFTIDKRFFMRMHTFIHVSSEKSEVLLESLCKRLRFLRRKMLEDLAEGQKIFVYKSLQKIDDEVALRLLEALNSFGTNRLLVVLPTNDDHPPSSIRVVNNRLIVGYLNEFSIANPAIQAWESVCQQAHVLFLPPAL